MKIDIISDVVCPWCYVGKRHLESALALRPDVEVEVQWFPFQLHPDAPAEGYAYRETIERKYGKARIEAMFHHLTEVGKAAGIEFNLDGIERGANTLKAHCLLDFAWQQGHQNALAEALFEAYFCAARDVGDTDTLLNIASSVGLDPERARQHLEDPEQARGITQQVEYARRNGVISVPTFSFDGSLAISGGQAPEVFIAAIDRALERGIDSAG